MLFVTADEVLLSLSLLVDLGSGEKLREEEGLSEPLHPSGAMSEEGVGESDRAAAPPDCDTTPISSCFSEGLLRARILRRILKPSALSKEAELKLLLLR
jgi:hypothetical protein